MISTCAFSRALEVCSSCEQTSIGLAIQFLDNGDTLFIKPGIYFENQLEVKKQVSIIGIGKPIIDANGENEIFVVFADSVLIKGLYLRNIGVSYLKDLAAIRLVRCKYVNVEQNTLENTFFGIYLQEASYCKVLNNTIQGNATQEYAAGNAIHIWKGTQILIEKNIAIGHRDGIYFEFVDSSRIINNLCEKNIRYGLHFMFSNMDVYHENVFRNNGVGVAVMFSKQIEMVNNRFEDNWGGSSYGILLKEISDGLMKNNSFIQNTRGIYAEGTNRLLIVNNEFLNNGWALDIKGNCDNNRIEGNNFIGNTFEVITNSKQNGNFFSNNYWDSYTGYDLDKDGIGDIPHYPVSLFALITQEIPASSMMLNSLLQNLMEYSEKVFPNLIPEQLVDDHPLMKPR